MDRARYLQRIGYHGALSLTAQTLSALQQAHLLSVPFENLDISLGRPIELDETALFEKIVQRGRGGFCYELNGLFAALLRDLGFSVTLLSAQVAHKNGGFGPPFDHLALLVTLEEPWLVDVGFGDSFRAPLRMEPLREQVQPEGSYRLSQEGALWTLYQQDGTDWQAQYCFTLQPHTLAEFVPMCHYQQTSPESHFTQGRVCTRATEDGRITLSELRLITTVGHERHEQALAGEDEFHALLQQHFGISL